MERSTPNDLNDGAADLARLTLDLGSLEDVVGQVTRIAVKALDGCEWAGLSLATGDRVMTAAPTDDLVGRVDAAQYQTGQGPCLQAIRDDAVYLVGSMADEGRFPKWSPQALAEGVSSSLLIPLKVQGEAIGALNLYAGREKGFTQADVPLAQGLADQVAVCLLNGQKYDRAVQLGEELQIALETRTMIGQATGILMEREGMDADEAFAALKRVSQKSNVKLRVVAQEIVDHHLATRTS